MRIYTFRIQADDRSPLIRTVHLLKTQKKAPERPAIPKYRGDELKVSSPAAVELLMHRVATPANYSA